jgi:hydrogenase-4 component F
MTERLLVRLAAIAFGSASLAVAGLALSGHGLVGGWLQLDAASGVLLAVNGTVGMFSAWLSPSYLAPDRHGLFGGSHRWYYLGLFVFWAALVAIPLTSNLGIAWLLVEATTGAAAVLIAHSGRRRALEAGWKYLVLTTVGLTVALLGIFYLYSALTGFGSGLSVLDWTVIGSAIRSVPPATANVAAVLIVVGFAAKVGWAPVHHWLPDAHSEAPAPVSALLSAALLPTVMLVVWRLEAALTGTPAAGVCRELFTGFGLVSLAVSVPFLWRPLPAKRLLAYSSLEHIGILAIGIGFGSPLALAGVVLHVWGHAAAKALGFYATIPLFRAQRTAARRPASGVARSDRRAAIGLGVSLGALSGLPPSPLFFSELLILAGGFASGQYLVAAATALLLGLGFVGLAHQLIEALLGRSHRVAALAGEAA